MESSLLMYITAWIPALFDMLNERSIKSKRKPVTTNDIL